MKLGKIGFREHLLKFGDKPTLGDMENIKLGVDIAQIITALLTLAGLLLSVYFSRKTLLEVQNDRRFNERPFLVFEQGGMELLAEEKNVKNDNWHEGFIKHIFPGDKPNVIPAIELYKGVDRSGKITYDYMYGKLMNVGNGPALEARITWKPLAIV